MMHCSFLSSFSTDMYSCRQELSLEKPKLHGKKLVLSGLTYEPYEYNTDTSKLCSLAEIEEIPLFSSRKPGLVDTVPHQSLALAHFHISSISKVKYIQTIRLHCAKV